jgi:hypothetical protein
MKTGRACFYRAGIDVAVEKRARRLGKLGNSFKSADQQKSAAAKELLNTVIARSLRRNDNNEK